MSFSPELQRLPPQALEVIRFLDGCDGPADLDAIRVGTGMSERTARKMIRRLITRYMLEMLDRDVYALSKKGKLGAEELRASDAAPESGESPPDRKQAPEAVASSVLKSAPESLPLEMPKASPPDVPSAAPPVPKTPAIDRTDTAVVKDQKQLPPSQERPAPPPSLPEVPVETPVEIPAPSIEREAVEAPVDPTPTQCEVHRRLSVMMSEEMVDGARSLMLVGFDAADPSESALEGQLNVVLRIEAPGCEVEPLQANLTLVGRAPVGPVQFRVRPAGPNPVSIRIRVYLSGPDQVSKPVGGIFFSRRVSPLPTPQSAELKALGAIITLR